MRTTLELPDELARRLQRRAAHDGRAPEEVAVDLLAAGLPPASGPSPTAEVVPKSLPLIKARPAILNASASLTAQAFCERIKDVELQDEVERYEKAFAHQYVDRADG